jgi:hypothetical protein
VALFRRKKKEAEQDTAETEAVVAEAPEAGGDGGRGSFIPEGERGEDGGGTTTAAPPPTPAARVDPPPEEEEEPAPAATATVEEEPAPEPEPEPEREREPEPTPAPEPAPEAPESPIAAHEAVQHDPFEQRPEVFVGAAFAGGFLLAQLLKWVGEDDE